MARKTKQTKGSKALAMAKSAGFTVLSTITLVVLSVMLGALLLETIDEAIELVAQANSVEGAVVLVITGVVGYLFIRKAKK